MNTYRVIVERTTIMRESITVQAGTLTEAVAIAEDHAAGSGSPRFMQNRVKVIRPAEQYGTDERVISVQEK